MHSLYLTVSGGAGPNGAPIATIDSLTFDKNIEPSSDQLLARLAVPDASQSACLTPTAPGVETLSCLTTNAVVDFGTVAFTGAAGLPSLRYQLHSGSVTAQIMLRQPDWTAHSDDHSHG